MFRTRLSRFAGRPVSPKRRYIPDRPKTGLAVLSTCFRLSADDFFTNRSHIHLSTACTGMSMPDPTAPSPTRRPLVTEAEYAALGKRQSERDLERNRRARDAQAARDEVNLWRWVPAVHAALIRTAVAAICKDLAEGRPPNQILSFARNSTAMDDRDTRSAPALWSASVIPDPADVHAAKEGPTLGTETDLPTGRRAQARRAAARKKAAGLKRLRLVVPAPFKPAVSRLLTQILTALEAGRIPPVNTVAVPFDETSIAVRDEPDPHLSAPTSPTVALPRDTGEGDAQAADRHTVHVADPDIAPRSPLPVQACKSSPHEIVRPRAAARWSGGLALADNDESHASLFYEIHAICSRFGLPIDNLTGGRAD